MASDYYSQSSSPSTGSRLSYSRKGKLVKGKLLPKVSTSLTLRVVSVCS